MVLWDYPIDSIKEAFKFWLATNRTFPKPADIVNVIERKGRPPLDKAVYGSLSEKRKRHPENLTTEEWAYIREYENFIINGK